MKTDAEIKKDVEEALKWTPDLDPTDIAVTVKDGVVTLAGFVHTYVEKSVAEAAAKRVAGVVGVANDLEVRLRGVDERPDPEIARTPWPRSSASCRSRIPKSKSSSKTAGSRSKARRNGVINASKRKKQSATSKALRASVISLK